MEINEQLASLANKAERSKDTLTTEEATKNALVMPFIMKVLGYDVFDPAVVIPEYTADVGGRKGEKVDYAILNSEEEVIFLIECKRVGDDLNLKHAAQLIRYFHATSSARIGVLTNGIKYEFYADLDAPNVMDKKPFLEFELTDLQDHAVKNIKKMRKADFDLEDILSSAGELKYTNLIIKTLRQQFEEPDDDFVKFFASRIHTGQYTQRVREQFTVLVKNGSQRFLDNIVDDRLKGALSGNAKSISEDDDNSADSNSDDVLETTEEEIEGFNIVKAIGRQAVEVGRISMRDTQSYCGVLLDDNNRKPICRLRFNSSSTKYIGLFDENKEETKHKVESVDDIYKYTDQIVSTIKSYVE